MEDSIKDQNFLLTWQNEVWDGQDNWVPVDGSQQEIIFCFGSLAVKFEGAAWIPLNKKKRFKETMSFELS